jgi:hypothetical protein
MQELVVTAHGFNPTLAAFVLLTRVSTNPLIADAAEAQRALAGLEPLQMAPCTIAERQAVTELERPDSKAATEIRFLYGAIYHD